MSFANLRQPIAVTMGDPAGVGPDVTARAWAARHKHSLPAFVAIGDAAAIEAVWDGPIARVGDMDEVQRVFDDALPVWHLEDSGPLTPGTPTAAGATCALHALETGIGLTRNQASSALVTGSVSKSALHGIGYTHPGQTEFIAERCGVTATNAVMMLAGPSLRVVPRSVVSGRAVRHRGGDRRVGQQRQPALRPRQGGGVRRGPAVGRVPRGRRADVGRDEGRRGGADDDGPVQRELG